MLRWHASRITYVEQLLCDFCYDAVDKLQRKLGRMENMTESLFQAQLYDPISDIDAAAGA